MNEIVSKDVDEVKTFFCKVKVGKDVVRGKITADCMDDLLLFVSAACERGTLSSFFIEECE